MVRAYVCMKLSKCPHIPLGHDLFFIPFYMLSTFFQNLSKILRNTVKGPSLMMVILIPRQNHKIFFSQDLVKQYYLFSGANVIDNVLFYTENMSCWVFCLWKWNHKSIKNIENIKEMEQNMCLLWYLYMYINTNYDPVKYRPVILTSPCCKMLEHIIVSESVGILLSPRHCWLLVINVLNANRILKDC